MNQARSSIFIKFILIALIVSGSLLIANMNVCRGTSLKARENTLKSDLSVMRQTIKNYTRDQGHRPVQLQLLVEAGYLRELPIDPVTRKCDWVVFTDSTTPSKTKPSAIIDVRSASTKKSTDNSAYNTW